MNSEKVKDDVIDKTEILKMTDYSEIVERSETESVSEVLATIVKDNNEILKTIIKDTIEKNVASIKYNIEMIMTNCKHHVEIMMTIANGIVKCNIKYHEMNYYTFDEFIV